MTNFLINAFCLFLVALAAVVLIAGFMINHG